MKPIRYRCLIAIRFADLDPYGHVNSSHYLDYVISSRWAFARQHLNVTERFFVEQQVGFYLTKAQMAFKRPILGGGSIIALSHVEGITDGRLSVPYEIRSEDETVLHSDGILEFATISLTTNKPISCPQWARELFFEKE